MEVASTEHRVDELHSVRYFESDAGDKNCELRVQRAEGTVVIEGDSPRAVFEGAQTRFEQGEPATWKMICDDTEFMRHMTMTEIAEATMAQRRTAETSRRVQETIVAESVN